MKKLLYILTIATMIIGCVGCSKEESDKKDDNKKVETQTIENEFEEDGDVSDDVSLEDDNVTDETEEADAGTVEFDYMYSDGCVMIKGYKSGDGVAKLEIPETIDGMKVCEISDNAFYGNEVIEELIIPDNVYIGKYAFALCSNLKNITFGEGLSLDEFAFMYCSSLESVVLPESITDLPATVFGGCESLKSVEFMGAIETIGENAFSGCGFEKITIPDTVKFIGQSAFSCESLREVHLSSADIIWEDGWDPFYDCDNLTIYAPAGSTVEEFVKEMVEVYKYNFKFVAE